jgi:hypothetical protein
MVVAALIVVTWLVTNQSTGGQAVSAGQSADRPPHSWYAELAERASTSNTLGREKLPFAVLSGPPVTMPERLRQVAQRTLGRGQKRLGLHFDTAHHLHTVAGIGIWAVRGAGVTCLFHDQAILAACDTNTSIAHKGLTMVGGRPSPNATHSLPASFLALGIAPDWAKAVRLGVIGRRSRVVRISHNTFVFRAAGPISVKDFVH